MTLNQGIDAGKIYNPIPLNFWTDIATKGHQGVCRPPPPRGFELFKLQKQISREVIFSIFNHFSMSMSRILGRFSSKNKACVLYFEEFRFRPFLPKIPFFKISSKPKEKKRPYHHSTSESKQCRKHVLSCHGSVCLENEAPTLFFIRNSL